MNQTKLEKGPPQASLFDEFRAALMDPPWLERGGGKVKRGADRHYPLMSKEKILSEVTRAAEWRMSPDSHLWMWVTNNFLQDGLWLMGELGYRYVTNAVWVKLQDKPIGQPEPRGVTPYTPAPDAAKHFLQIGLGQYMRGAHELLLFGVAGQARVPPPSKRPPTVIFAPRGQHSKKPDEQYKLVETVSAPPAVEFFARRTRPGWTAWGNEV